MQTRHNNTNAPRRGVSLLELTGGLVMLGTILMLIAQMTTQMDRLGKSHDSRATASRTLENLMERVAVQPWDQITNDALSDLPLPEAATRSLPDAKLTAEVTDEAQPVESKRVVLRIAWTPTPGAQPAGLSLTTIFYSAAGEKP